MKTTALSKNSIHTSLQRYGLLLVPLLLGCFALLPRAQAVGPDTDGSIPGANNGEGVGVLVSRTTGIWNTGTGFEALNHLTAGNQNTATGFRALVSDTSGGFNSATGVYSLFSNTTGFFNSATGAYSLAHNTTASNNTANGYSALYGNTTGELNTAIGYAALYSNTEGEENTATGYAALYRNVIGDLNTANGSLALNKNTIGNFNTAIGRSALENNTTGERNTALGFAAGAANTTGSTNTFLGWAAGGGPPFITASNVIVIGTAGANVSNSCFIGNIFGATSSGGTAVFINSDGKLGTTTSSRRFKEEIKPMERASEALFALKPVTFRYKKGIDPQGIPQFGLVAEDVEAINPDLVVRDAEGEVNTVRYEAVNAMLLNEFLKEHKKVEAQHRRIQEQDATITQLKSDAAKQEVTISQLEKRMELFAGTLQTQAAQIQKVSAQLELHKPAPRTVVENR